MEPAQCLSGSRNNQKVNIVCISLCPQKCMHYLKMHNARSMLLFWQNEIQRDIGPAVYGYFPFVKSGLLPNVIPSPGCDRLEHLFK